MNNYQQYLWPLAGVVLGWLLSLISGGWKSRVERKKLVGRLLSKLLVVSGDVHVLKTSSDHFKELSDGSMDYERFRQRISTHHFLEPADKRQDLHLLASSLSEYYPFEAQQLQATLHYLSKLKDAKFDSASADQSIYVQLLSMHELSVDACDKELARIVAFLARKHGLLTRLKLWRDRRRKAANFDKNSKRLIEYSRGHLIKFGRVPRK